MMVTKAMESAEIK